MHHNPQHGPLPSRTSRAIEPPTLLLAILIHGAWLMLTAWHAALPPVLLGIAGGIIVAWHGSLQHETIHGHPTSIAWVNRAIGSAPLSLWLPYAVYHRTHVAHHATPDITDPFDDPESQYLARASGLRYRLARIEATLPGRLLLGPPVRIGLFLLSELRRGMDEPKAVARDWLPHLAGVAMLLWWLDHVGLSLGTYLLAFVYPGTALSLLRSFAEHRAHADRASRAAIIPKAGPFGLLFLNNNLHAVHHAYPGVAWYDLPAQYRRHRVEFAADPHYPGYGAIARLHLLRPHDTILHPAYAGEDGAA